jgi:hypothetical protein
MLSTVMGIRFERCRVVPMTTSVNDINTIALRTNVFFFIMIIPPKCWSFARVG